MALGIGEAYALACAFLWATAVILFKQAGESLSPFALNYFKNWLCLICLGLTLLVWPGWQPQAMPTDAVLIALISGVLGLAVADTLYFKALNAIGAARMGIVGTAYSPSVIVLAVLFLGERLNLWQSLGVVLTLAGITLVTWHRTEQQLDAATLRRGALIGGLSVFAMACGVVMAKPVLDDYDFLQVVTLRMVASVVVMSVMLALQRRIASIFAEYRRVKHWPQVIAGGFMGSYLSMICWLLGYKYADASIAAVINELSALFIVVLAAIVLHDRMVKRQLWGGALAVFGVVFVVLAKA